MSEEKRRYMSYLLRLWEVKVGGGLIWRASLESSQTGEQQGFASLEELFAYLRQASGPAMPAEEGREEKDTGSESTGTS